MICQLPSDAIWSTASDDEPGALYLACLRPLEQWEKRTLLSESWSESLFAPALTKGKWLEKVNFSFFKGVLHQLQGNLNRPWMNLEGEDSFHSHLWMLSCGNDLSKSRTFSSLFYSSERNALFIQYESRIFLSLFILWVFPSYLSLLIILFLLY